MAVNTYHVVAWHQGDIPTVVYADEETARSAYNLVSSKYAKVLWSMGRGCEVDRYGGTKWADLAAAAAAELTVSDEWRASVTTLAWHESNHVNSIGFTTPKYANFAYDKTSRSWAKTLVAAPSYSTFTKHGGDKWVNLAHEGIKSMPLAPIFIVAWHIAIGSVRVVALPKPEDAKKVYDLISKNYAKCVWSSGANAVETSYGGQQWVDKCVEVSTALAATGQRRSSSFCVGYHANGCVTWESYADISSALEAYEGISDRYAKVIVAQPTGAVVTQYGSSGVVQTCLDELPAFLKSYNEVVAFHARGSAHTIVYADSACAAAAYDLISPSYAKVLISSTRGELKRYGGSRWADASKAAAEKVLASGCASDQRSDTVLVAYHAETGVNVLGYADAMAAIATYSAISSNYAKVIVDGPNRTEVLRYGGDKWVNKCLEYVNGLFK